MDGVGASFSLPFKSRGWFGTFALQGLIFLIPVIGQMAMYGWALRQLDSYRQGRTELVPAGFHLTRGLNIWVVWSVWSLPGLAISAYVYLTFFPAMLGAFGTMAHVGSTGGTVSGFPPSYYTAMANMNNFAALSSLLGLVLAALLPAIWTATEREGIVGGFNVPLIWALASRRWGYTLAAAACILAGMVVSGVGILACCIGIVFTLPYGYAVLAGVLRYYEYTFEVPVPAQPPTYRSS